MISPKALKAQTGKLIGRSDWIEITQEMIAAHAETTFDRQYIHVDPERAAKGPFGGTIAHGFLSLSLLAVMAREVLPTLEGEVFSVNYGLDKVRFLQPVPAGARLCGEFTLNALEEKKPFEITLKLGVRVLMQGTKAPAFIAEWILRYYLKKPE